MQKQDFSPELERDVYQAFKQIFITTPDPLDTAELYERLSRTPAPRFYVSEETALRHISRLSRHLEMNALSPLRRAMYTEIAFRSLDRHRQTGKTLKECVCEVIFEPAPSFYLTPLTLKYKVCRYRARLRKERQNR